MSARLSLLALVLAVGMSPASAQEPGRTRLGRLDPWAFLQRSEAPFAPDASADARANGSWRLYGDPGYPLAVDAAATFRGRLHVASSAGNSLGTVSSWSPDLGWQEEIDFFRPRVLLGYDGGLVIAGWHAFGNIRFWDGGDELLDMGDGLRGGLAGPDGTIVHALIIHNGFLLAGGAFEQSNGVPTGPVARWNGTQWEPHGTGLVGRVRALVSFQGELIAAGDVEIFSPGGALIGNGVARWTGARWVPHGVVEGWVRTLAEAGGELYAEGDSAAFGGAASGPTFARWDAGSWTPIGQPDGPVRTLLGFEGELWAGGEFEQVDGVTAANVAVWDGVAWREPAGGTEGGREVRSLAVHAEQLHLLGEFDWAGRTQGRNVARWTGDDWRTYGAGMSSEVHGIRHLPTGTHAFGEFQLAGGVPAAGLARWDGEFWHPYGDGFDRRVHDVNLYQGELIAAGRFTRSGSQPVSSIARWDGTAWLPLGSGLNDYAYTLAVLDDVLYVGGAFTRAGSVDATGLAAWDGQDWSAVAGGVDGGWPFGPSVLALQAMPGRLVVGGAFESAGALEVPNVAFHDLGNWSAPGPGLDNWVTSFALLDDEVVAGGAFDDKVVRWTGTAWQPVGGGLSRTVLDLSPYRDGLAAIHPGTADVVRLLTGNSWDNLLGFTNPEALNAVEWDGWELWIGGPFALVEGEPSRHVARWKPDPDFLAPIGTVRAPAWHPPASPRLRVLENPFRDRLVLRIDGDTAPASSLELFDVAGRRRARLVPVAGENTRIEWDPGPLPAGVYFVRLRTGDDEEARKVVKSR